MIEIQVEHLITLIEASLNADYSAVRKVSNQISSEIKAEHPDLAKRLQVYVRRAGVPLRASGYMESLPVDSKSRSPLLEQEAWPTTPLFISADLKVTFDDFIEGINNQQKLIDHGLSGKMNLLISGPPGTGKSLIAGHIASKLKKNLYLVRLDSLVSSLLGDTAKNIRAVFDFIADKNGILFLDEFDAIAKLRNDQNELGELKRVVNTLLQAIDSLDDKTIIIAATNHPELLDKAIWRRFPYKMDADLPCIDLREHLWNFFLFNSKGDKTTIKALSKISKNFSGSDIESIATKSRRTALIRNEEVDLLSISSEVLKTNNKFSLEENISKTVSILKNKYHLTQAEICKILKISRPSVSKYLKE